MKVFLGADHAGYELKNMIREHLFHNGYEAEDLGAKTLNAEDDYPQYAYAVAAKVIGSEADDRGIMVCGSGQGMAIAANRVRGIRASVIWDVAGAKETRQDNDSNVLSLPARMINTETALAIVDAWLAEPFNAEGPNARHRRRLDELEDIYG